MSKKDLKDKAIDIKGKAYVMVKDRLIYFNETYPEGSITTNLVSEPTSEMVIVKATVWPDIKDNMRQFTGYSQAVIGEGMVNKTAALENAETSAVGRALAMMGIGVLESIASADEMVKAETNFRPPSDKQLKWIRDTAAEVNDQLDYDKADEWIEQQIGVKITEMPGWKTKEVVDKLKIPVKPAQNESINLDEIPY